VPNELENLINAAELLRNENISFLLVGEGHLKSELKDLVETKKLDNISMCESIPKSFMPKLLRSVDVGFIGAKNRPIYKHGISPNKIADYMMAEIPVISAIEAGNDPVKEADCGCSVAPSNPEALASTILYMDSIGQSERKIMGQRGKEYVLQNYSYDILAKKFVEAFK
jgi:glycosyltransferase involved in cell wall biosynthesis